MIRLSTILHFPNHTKSAVGLAGIQPQVQRRGGCSELTVHTQTSDVLPHLTSPFITSTNFLPRARCEYECSLGPNFGLRKNGMTARSPDYILIFSDRQASGWTEHIDRLSLSLSSPPRPSPPPIMADLEEISETP